jgi:uncharacterized RDD family membrane protein YckC
MATQTATITTKPAQEPVRYPSLSDRVQSTFIDVLIIVFMMVLISGWLEGKDEEAPDWLRIALFFGLWAFYEPVATSLGGTVGNLVKGIRVRRMSDPSRRIAFPAAFIRYVLKTALGWISFLTMHSNTERRAIHDFAAGSVMICK